MYIKDPETAQEVYLGDWGNEAAFLVILYLNISFLHVIFSVMYYTRVKN